MILWILEILILQRLDLVTGVQLYRFNDIIIEPLPMICSFYSHVVIVMVNQINRLWLNSLNKGKGVNMCTWGCSKV